MQSIRIGIRQNTDFIITQFAQVVRIRINANGNGNVVDFFTGKHRIRRHFPRVQNLASQGHNRLKMSITCLFCRATCRIPFHQKQLCAISQITATICQFAWQCRSLGDFFTLNFFGGFQPFACFINRQFSDLFGNLRVLIEPQAKAIFGKGLHHACRFSAR